MKNKKPPPCSLASDPLPPPSRLCTAVTLALASAIACHGAISPARGAQAPVAAPPSSERRAAVGAGAASASSGEPLALASALAAGPAPSVAPVPRFLSSKFTAKNEPAWRACHAAFNAEAKDVAKTVSAMAMGCAKATKMKILGTTITGRESDSESPQSYALKAEANRCYRVYAQADPAIKDFNVAIKDSTGALSDQHSNGSGAAVVVDDGAVCFTVDDAASVVFSVGMGGGPYALQIWAD